MPGAYLLLLTLNEPTTILRPKATELPAGDYVYAGSANGPGGLQARLGRHLRPDKKARWHIDHLSLRAAALYGAWYTDQTECQLREALQATGLFQIPCPGFGSSDCRTCLSHLLRWQSRERPL
ncbi:GIY-YIG nuclease family protein [Coralliovum pocilloporae]|uniref:GIY-YIG nuclease family protein n=1 Tax=Coralliovum pocilloporae TaxID=3066369 RepID=UPI003306B2DB